MRLRIAVAVVAGATLLGGCGNTPQRVTASDEPRSVPTSVLDATSTTSSTATTAPARPVQSQADVCAPEEDATDYNGQQGQAVGATQGELQGDAEIVRQYGQQHADEFTQVGFDNYPVVKLVGVFTANLDRHRDALRRQLALPDSFEVRLGVLSAKDADAMQKTINAEPKWQGLWTGDGVSGLNGHVSVTLRSTKAALTAAKEMHERWGRTICIEVGGHPYPKGAWPDASRCPDEPMRTDRNSDVEFRLMLDKPALARGEVGTGIARITNHGTTPLSTTTGSTLGASVFEPGSTSAISGLSEASADVARTVNTKPGETVEIPLRFGTDDCRPNSDYSLPTGTYAVSSYLKGYGRSDEVTVTVVDQ